MNTSVMPQAESHKGSNQHKYCDRLANIELGMLPHKMKAKECTKKMVP